MALPPHISNSGYDLDHLLQIVSNLERAGLLDEFIRAHPHYLIGVEVARAVLQRIRSNNAAIRGIVPAPSSSPQAVSPLALAYVPATVPSAPSIRDFVTLISQLLEELRPIRQQMLTGPQPAIGDSKASITQQSQGYQQFNPDAAMSFSPQQGADGFSPQMQNGMGFPPYHNNDYSSDLHKN